MLYEEMHLNCLFGLQLKDTQRAFSLVEKFNMFVSCPTCKVKAAVVQEYNLKTRTEEFKCLKECK